MVRKSAINDLPIDKFKELIAKSTSWKQVMIYFKENYGYKNTSHSFTAKKRCDKEKIDYSHFGPTVDSSSFTKEYKYPLSKLLVLGSKYSSSTLRKRLIENNILEEKCRDCGIGPEYNGKPLTLQLEHINGNHSDNRLENLTILCPNCHTQTNTWAVGQVQLPSLPKCIGCQIQLDISENKICIKCLEVRSSKDGTKCIDCMVVISGRATRCLSCSSKKYNRRKIKNRPTLEQLREDLKTLNMTKVGKKYGVSDNCVRKWLKSYNT